MRLSSALAAAAVTGGLLVAAPSAPAAAAGCPAVPPVLSGARSTARALAPGVVVRTWTLPRQRGRPPAVAHVVTADLRSRRVRVDLLAGPVTGAATLPDLVARSGALVAVNGDFFDLGGRGAVFGPEVQGGRLRKGTRTAALALGVGADRRGRVAPLAMNGSVALGTGTSRRAWPLASLNAEQQPADGFAAYTSLWGPVGVPAPAGALQVVLARDRVVRVVRSRGHGLAVPPGSVVLVARGRAGRHLTGVRAGTPLAVRARQAAAVPFRTALGGGLPLVRRGALQSLGCSVENEAPRPRTAAGVSGGGRYLLLVVVEGAPVWERHRAPGLSVRETAALLRAAGAADALMLDGGGSAQVVARPGDRGAPVSLSRLEDGELRRVPNALAVSWR